MGLRRSPCTEVLQEIRDWNVEQVEQTRNSHALHIQTQHNLCFAYNLFPHWQSSAERRVRADKPLRLMSADQDKLAIAATN